MPARKLTPRVREQLVEAVAAGGSYRAAAEYVGVSDRTLRSWLARGRAERDAPRLARGERPYVKLLEAVERAEGGAELRHVALISRAASEDWRASAWWLAHRHPEDWTATVRVEHDDEPGSLEQLLEEATVEELEILQGLAMRRTQGG